MKRVWKPVGLLGLRLYKVTVMWPVTPQTRRVEESIVAANSPSEAAKIVAEQYANLPDHERPSCSGGPLNVCQPAEWWDGPKVESLPHLCKHDRTRSICGGSGAGPDGAWREDVSLCMDCGRIKVTATRNGQFIKVEFGLGCDDHLRAAARYMRSDAETADAIEKAKQ